MVRRLAPWLTLLALGACGIGSGKTQRGTLPGGSDSAGSGGGGGSDAGLIDPTSPNPCQRPDAPPQCKLVPSGPACGDGKLNQPSEACDDGNSLPGDGCSGVCKVEAYFECPTPGAPCVSTIVCGDGVVGPGEACDDGNDQSGDGCSAKCNAVEKGFACRTAGEPCVRVHFCGDGTVDPNEGCDDGNARAGDGCDAKCRMELGFKCSGSPSSCTPTVCGDGVVEGAESCDDGNTLPFDGCSATCQAEPDCSGGSCASSCGDGIVLGEECDDGNLRNGDGCSSDCKIEVGHKCANDSGVCRRVNGLCTMPVPAVYRDFKGSNEPGGHPDFQPSVDNANVIPGLVRNALDAAGKPVWSGATNGFIHSAESFNQWYRDAPPVNATIVGTLTLWQNSDGSFVNRWGANGEQWVAYEATPGPRWCGNGGTNCGSCTLGAGEVCLSPCLPWGMTPQECAAVPVYYDGNPAFFPIDDDARLLPGMRYAASIPPQYGWNWTPDPSGKLHNFHFTTEVHYWFLYDAAGAARLDFTGDDDVWVFVNGHLAVDLGGWHTPLDGSVTIDAASAATFGLSSGRVYQIAVFQAERKTNGSSFKLTLSGFNLAPSDCSTDCGDGVVAVGEECDDGVAGNKGDYDGCNPDCTLGPRCGDGIRQDQFGELCDDGVNDGSYGGCAPNCTLGPHCGDGVVQPGEEQCDDGVNDGGYGECFPGCTLGPYCGDGVVAPAYEDCDDGNNLNEDGCSSACKLETGVPG